MPLTWSAWAWVNSTASIWGIFSLIACRRRSGDVSTRIYLPSVRTRIEARVRLSRGLAEEQTEQSQPTMGTPVDVPHPRIVIIILMNSQEIGEIRRLK